MGLGPDVQEELSQVSNAFGAGAPPSVTAAADVPKAPFKNFTLFKAGDPVHAEPLYSSTVVDAAVLYPPIHKDAVCVPAPPGDLLAADKAPPAVHEEPLYSSVAFVLTAGGVEVIPPNNKPAV